MSVLSWFGFFDDGFSGVWIDAESFEFLAASLSMIDMALKLRSLALDAAKEGKSLDSVERATWSLVLQMGREAIELFIRSQGTGDLGPTLTNAEDQCVVRSDLAVSYQSTIGR